MSFLAILYALGTILPAGLPTTGGAGFSQALWSSPVTPVAAATGAGCGWREPPQTYPDGARWTCTATDWADGDTLTAKCDGRPEPVTIRLRGVDTDESGDARWWQAREELRRRTADRPLAVVPHHRSYRRVVADVLAAGVNVGEAMDAAGWSKSDCPKR